MIALGNIVHPKFKIFRIVRRIIATCVCFLFDHKKLFFILGESDYYDGKYNDAILQFKKCMRDGFDEDAYQSIYKCNLTTRNRIPPIFINSIEKAGSTFIEHSLARGLGLPMHNFNNGIFWPNREIDPGKLSRMLEDHGICKQHMFPTPHNLEQIENAFDRIIIHVRDPRQALLSWVHQIEDDRFKKKYISSGFSTEDYYQFSLHDKINWQIENHYGTLIDWFDQWLRVDQERTIGTRIKFTSFENMISNQYDFFNEILDFYEIDRLRFIPPPPPSETVNFRKGLKDEWRAVFTKEQINLVDRLLPDRLVSVFDWER